MDTTTAHGTSLVNLTLIENDEQLSDYWPRVRAGLEVVLKKNPANWIPEDVYMQVKLKNSLLVVGEDSTGEFVGFYVMTMRQVFDGLECFMWISYNKGEKSIIEFCEKRLKDFCQHAGARRIVTLSNRPGWAKFGERFGFKQTQIQFECEL